MVTEYQYTSIRRVLDNILDHPLLKDVNLDQAVRHTIRFISIHGYSKLYKDKIEDVEIHDFRGLLPCDLISIIQIKDLRSGVCLRHMTDDFIPAQISDNLKDHGVYPPPHPPKDLLNNVRQNRIPEPPEHPMEPGYPVPPDHPWEWYIPHAWRYREEPAFKTQGRCLYTNFPEGVVAISYKSIPVDSEGFPLLIDNENYLAALEAYIKKQVFTVKFDTGKISANVLQNAKQDYAWLAAQLRSEFTMPSYSEMEALTRYTTSLIPRMREFDNGFKNLGDREYLRRH